MNRIMIVEDEKLIRQGIKSIIENSEAKVTEIIECRDGEEAWALLQSGSFDAVFTDIRMPKMDGITLVSKIDTMDHKPYIVVISGYGDFSYAVEMLRHNVIDYILKPVNRNEIYRILEKLEKLINDREKMRSEDKRAFSLKIKNFYKLAHFMEQQNLILHFNQLWRCDQFRVICSPRNYFSNIQSGLFISDLEGHDILILTPMEAERYLEYNFLGISSVYKKENFSLNAVRESIQNREEAFFTMKKLEKIIETDLLMSENQAEKHVYLINKPEEPEELRDILKAYTAAVCEDKNLISQYKNFIFTFIKKMNKIYKVSHNIEIKSIYTYLTVQDYLKALYDYIDEINQNFEQNLESVNQKKIVEAIQFIKENYNKSLNMATVSNHVSMNYSLFSIFFKQEVGCNFVSYLRDLRIKKAQELLQTTDFKIKEIGKMVGYEDEKHFLKVFKQECGLSPKEFKQNTPQLKKNIIG